MLSIVVPVYKVEKYLERCVESLCAQTLRNIEIILVNDGSPDRCPELCEALAREDSRIRVVHKENGGLSSARNAGLRAANGTYVGFVDSDDTVSPDMFEKLRTVIEREQVDFVMADYLRIPENGEPYLKTLEIRPGRYDKAAMRREIYPQLIMGENVDYGPLLSVWHCLYRTDFLRANRFYFDEEVRWSEDNIFSAIVGYHADSFFYLKGEGLYRYHQNPGTITTSYRPGAWEVYCTMNRHLHAVFDAVTDYDFSRQLKLHLFYYACVCVNQTGYLAGEKRKTEMMRILDTSELRLAFQGFRFAPLPVKLRIQLELMRWRQTAILERMLFRRK